MFNLFILVFVGLAAAYDIATRRIPNWLTILGIGFGLLFNVLQGPSQLADGLIGFLCGAAIMFVPFAMGWLGAGDVKLMAVIGLMLGVGPVLDVLLYSAMSGGVLALLWILYRRTMNCKIIKQTWTDLKLMVLSKGQILPAGVSSKLSNGAGGIPYGVAIALGVLFVYLDSRGLRLEF